MKTYKCTMMSVLTVTSFALVLTACGPEINRIRKPMPAQIAKQEAPLKTVCSKTSHTSTKAVLMKATPAEIAKLSSGFLYKTGRRMKHKTLGYVYRTKGGFPLVKKAQILFKFVIPKLPATKAVENVSATLSLGLKKYTSLKGKMKWEYICLPANRVCSGQKTFLSRKGYENSSVMMANNYFSELKISKGRYHRRGYYRSAGILQIPVKNIFSGMAGMTTKKVIFGDDSAKMGARTVYFVVGDDSYVTSQTKLTVNYEKKTCSKAKQGSNPQQKSIAITR